MYNIGEANKTHLARAQPLESRLDTEKGSFEVVNKQGKHQGEVNFDGKKISGADDSGRHDLIVK